MASFADYVKDLMSVLPTVNGNPMLSVTSQTDAAKYRENPFYMQDEIRKRILAEEEVKKAAEAEARAAMAQERGMMGGGGGSDGATAIDPSVLAYLNAENSTARGIRNNAAIDALLNPLGGGSVGAAMGLTDSMGFTTPGRMAQMAYQYNNTPDFLKGVLPQSYANAAGFISQSDSIFGGMNPAGQVSMGAQQAAALAAQDAGLFDSPAERAAWYSDNSSSSSDSGGSSGGYSDGYSSSGGGGYTSSADGSYGGYI